jgi:hypothetical protein
MDSTKQRKRQQQSEVRPLYGGGPPPDLEFTQASAPAPQQSQDGPLSQGDPPVSPYYPSSGTTILPAPQHLPGTKAVAWLLASVSEYKCRKYCWCHWHPLHFMPSVADFCTYHRFKKSTAFGICPRQGALQNTVTGRRSACWSHFQNRQCVCSMRVTGPSTPCKLTSCFRGIRGSQGAGSSTFIARDVLHPGHVTEGRQPRSLHSPASTYCTVHLLQYQD